MAATKEMEEFIDRAMCDNLKFQIDFLKIFMEPIEPAAKQENPDGK